MKKILLLAFTFFCLFAFAQSSEDKTWDLLFNNKRQEARLLFDKSFAEKKTSNYELLLLDALIDEELGEYNFDETFLKNFLNLHEDANYLFPMSHRRFVIGDIKDYGIDDLTYKKIDLLASSPQFQDQNFVLSFKAVLEKNLKNDNEVKNYLEKLNRIKKWQRAGVFENLNGSGIDIEYEPETYAKNDKLFNANSYGKVGWYNPSYNPTEGFEFLSNESEYGSGIVYAQSFVDNPEGRRVLLEMNVNTEYKVFVNDQEILSTTKDGYTNPGTHTVEFFLPKGMNRLLLKMAMNHDTAFMGVLFNEKYDKIKDLKYYDTYQPYNQSSVKELAAIEKPLRFESFLTGKILQNPDKPFYKFLLASGYLANSQFDQAKEVTEELLKKYPTSTMLRMLLGKYYLETRDTAKRAQNTKSIQTDDPDNYIIPILKFGEEDWIENASVSDLETEAAKLRKTKADFFADLYTAIAAAKKRDFPEVLKYVKIFKEKTYNNESMFPVVAPMEFVDRVDQTLIMKSFEDFLAKKTNITVMYRLANLYKNAGKNEESKKLYLDYITKYPNLNLFRSDFASVLADNMKDPEILNQLNMALDNFPYSYNILAMKADLFAKQNRKDEALKLASEVLSHNSAYTAIIKLQRDLQNREDEIVKAGIKDFSTIISERRNTNLKGSKGVTTLLDEYIVNVFPEGGYKTRSTYVFEITSAKGVDEMKEYYSNGTNIIKAEITKRNGSIVPGEKSYDQAVFTNIEVGDVITIQSEGIESSSGRFYKDFNLTSYFASSYPVVESVFTVITPENMPYQSKANNGTIPSVVKKAGGKIFETWRMTNIKELNLDEAFSVGFNEQSTSVTVNTIKSWKEIADWYADLTKKSMVYDTTVDKVFKTIFPSGTNGISDLEKAQKIYNYIEKNISYSSVNFRQSGYIPQKPSKTLVTKLGDCKDISTLFVVLGKQAGLKSNLVLVKTNNFSDSNLLLPNFNFNHCIVQANLDGKIFYLEMTDKYLPFNSLVKGNYHAKGLVINHDKSLNTNSEIFDLPGENNLPNILKTVTQADFKDADKRYRTVQYIQSASKSFYNEFFTEEKTDEEMKNHFEETFGNVVNGIVKVNSVKLISGRDLTANPIAFEVNYKMNDTSQLLGNMHIVKIPFVTKPFTKEIIAVENRTSDIQYTTYENQNFYDEEVNFILPDNYKFIEIPKSESFEFKNFKYAIHFDRAAPNLLKVTRKASTPWENISVKDYPAFKLFVEKIMTAENQVLGYKTD
ncbi:tetratricopeptide repeat protein [Chryseobacterium sp.]|uniref:transglutaminase domain-containing protein n=1 Tax=Chryseobacterium sp. TaxID=1871047 RepID=UPI0011C93201|nr:tetratricopeptide repeat protein [Chryseobacterium sp.]TXF79392.1 tetratricopeptide repeat protein [Chryseobacterium sp.]